MVSSEKIASCGSVILTPKFFLIVLFLNYLMMSVVWSMASALWRKTWNVEKRLFIFISVCCV